MAKQVKVNSEAMLTEPAGKLKGAEVVRLVKSRPALARIAVADLSIFDLTSKRAIAYATTLAPENKELSTG